MLLLQALPLRDVRHERLDGTVVHVVRTGATHATTAQLPARQLAGHIAQNRAGKTLKKRTCSGPR